MAVTVGQVVCPSNADTVVVPAANTSTDASAGNYGHERTVVLSNPSAQGIYIGDSAETAATGFLLATNVVISLTLQKADAIYGRGASASPTIHFIESSG